MKAPSRADAAIGPRLLLRCQSRPPTGCGLAEVVCADPRPESGPGAGEKKVEGTGKIRGFGKVDRLEQRKRETPTISVPQMPSVAAERMKNATPKFTH